VVLGLAELAKTTLILFYPLWPLMWIIYRMWPSFSETRIGVSERRRYVAHDWLREAGMLAMRLLIGLYILNLGYAFEGSFTQLKDFHFFSNVFTGRESRLEGRGPDNPHSAALSSTLPASRSVNRFSHSWLGQLPAPFPKNYVLGIDIQQRDFEDYGRPSYLRGKWQDRGWWYYYIYACAIKVPLGLWALGFLVLLVRLTANAQRLTTPLRDEFILLLPAIVIFTVVSSKTGFSEHTRYVLPAFPFVFIAVSQIARIFRRGNSRPISFSRCPRMT